MQFAISNLPFMGFRDAELVKFLRTHTYDLELFYEFGTEYYWDSIMSQIDSSRVKLSVHAPCVSVNLADATDKTWFRVYKDTILFAAKYHAEFVVVHTNELWQGDRCLVQRLVEERLLQIATFAKEQGVHLLIENVGLISKDSLLYDWEEYQDLLERFSECGALIDTGHAYINGWDLVTVVRTLGDRMQAMHLHDNDGRDDLHRCIGHGDIYWESVFAAITAYAPQTKLVLEYSDISGEQLGEHIEALKCKYGLD